MLFHTHPNFLFIHIPKTAGSSMKGLIRNHYNKNYKVHPVFTTGHMNITTLYNYEESPITHDNKHTFLKFTIVRNPYSRMVSFYNAMLNLYKIDETLLSFNSFLKNDIPDYGKYCFDLTLKETINQAHLSVAAARYRLNCYDYILDEMDHIIYFEDMEKGFTELNELLNTTIFDYKNLPRFKIFNEDPLYFKKYYTEEEIQLVNTLCSKDFEYLAYQKW